MRRILGDRLSGGIFAALVAYVLAVQGLLSAFAQGALAAPRPDTGFVICSLAGGVSARPDRSHLPLERAAHHCCAALCHAAAAHSPALPAADAAPAFLSREGGKPQAFSPHVPLLPAVLGLAAEARAPPFLSA